MRKIFFEFIAVTDLLHYKVRQSKVNKVIWIKSVQKGNVLTCHDYFHVDEGMDFSKRENGKKIIIIFF